MVRFGVPLLDGYLEFLAVRSRPNTVAAVEYDLKVFFTAVGKPPVEVVAADVLAFVTAQHTGGPAGRLQAVDADAVGVSARTVRRRLSSVSGLFAFLMPAVTWPPTRSRVDCRPGGKRQRPRQGVPLVRTPRTLPRILEPGQVDALLAASFHSYAMRERLRNANGHADNQIIWTFPGPGLAPPAPIADQSFLLMDRWLAAVEADHSSAPRSVKILRHKPADAVDACFVDGVKVTDPNTCRATFPFYGDPRIAAGAPLANDVLKCQLEPLNPRDYNVAFTLEQWTRLRQAFPHGMCDYRKPGADRVPSVPWLTYQNGPGGRPLGPAPESRP